MHDHNTPIPDGYCMCGCGEKTEVSPENDASKGWVKGQPKRFIRYHQNHVSHIPDDPNPSGICQCGCGEQTSVFTSTKTKDGAYRGHHARYIKGHYGRHNGDLYTIEDRGFSSPCWIWKRYIDPVTGYGRLYDKGIQMQAHRWMYEKEHGPILPGLEADHLCRVRSCVNPDHIEPVTSAVNTQRGANAKLNPDIVREIRRRAETETQVSIARDMGLPQSTVNQIVTRRMWRNID